MVWAERIRMTGWKNAQILKWNV